MRAWARVIPFIITMVPGLVALAAQAEDTAEKQLERGELVYNRFCAFCHGKNLEGQANWRKRKANGKLPAPPP